MSSLAEQVAQHYWHHSIDLGGGVVTPGRKSLAVINQEADAIFGPIDLAGRSVIDIGAWNGFFSFEAKRRGAVRVLATDEIAWTQNGVRGRETFQLARAALNLDIEELQVDVMELSPQIGQFDVTLFLGVLYHLIDPIKGIEKAACVTKDLLIVETYMDALELDRPAMIFYPGTELAGDSSNWWGPNIACVAGLLRWAGFPTVFFQPHPHSLGRGIFHAFRSPELVARYVGERTPGWRALSEQGETEVAGGGKTMLERQMELVRLRAPEVHRLLHSRMGLFRQWLRQVARKLRGGRS
jgi:tRNA (mo5U34)-methyltransferase